MAIRKSSKGYSSAATKKSTTRSTPAKYVAKKSASENGGQAAVGKICSAPEIVPRTFAPGVGLDQQRSIINLQSKWVNGTELRYCFLNTPAKWRGSNTSKRLVRDAFEVWHGVNIGLKFIEVKDPDEAELRIGFEQNDGHWSYLGRGVLNYGPSEKTMNLDPPFDLDTAIHEIGHSIGLPHEHQNPHSGIQWNEPAVYAALAAPPNNWTPQVTHWNILRKLDTSEVQGSSWDPKSVMHYQFEAALIDAPAPYNTQGITPPGGLSAKDKQWVRSFYPPLKKSLPQLKPFRSMTRKLDPGEQVDFEIRPTATRTYQIQTFGQSDTVMVLFEDVDGDLRHRDADDDSGMDYNAKISTKLYSGGRYVLRVRLYWQYSKGDFAVMLW